MTRRMGIDLGARKVSWSTFVDNTLIDVDHYEAFTHVNRATELHSLVKAIAPSLEAADEIVIEEPFMGRGGATLLLAQTAGALLAHIGRTSDSLPTLVPVSSWKMTIVGNGAADKKKVATWLAGAHSEYHARCEGNQDRVDAVCIGLYAVELGERAAAFANGKPL